MPNNDIVREHIIQLEATLDSTKAEVIKLSAIASPLRLKLRAIDYSLMKLRAKYRRLDSELYKLRKPITKIAPKVSGRQVKKFAAPAAPSTAELISQMKKLPKDELLKALGLTVTTLA